MRAGCQLPLEWCFETETPEESGRYHTFVLCDCVTAKVVIVMEEKQPLRESSGHNGFAAGLVLLGVVFHACYVFSIFDIYFKSPIVHGMQPVKVSAEPPAKRVIFFVGERLS